MPETTAEPLPRLGSYTIQEKPGTNPARWEECGYDHPCHEDLQDEAGVCSDWRTRLSAIARTGA